MSLPFKTFFVYRTIRLLAGLMFAFNFTLPSRLLDKATGRSPDGDAMHRMRAIVQKRRGRHVRALQTQHRQASEKSQLEVHHVEV